MIDVGIETVTATDYGYRIERSDEYTVEVHKMLYNWRLVVGYKDDPNGLLHGYCYFGTGYFVLLRAIGAGLMWKDPLNEEPMSYDKKAY